MFKDWLKFMARPRVIKLEKGEVSLHGFAKEDSDALCEHIKQLYKKDSSVATVLTPTPRVVSSSLVDKALSVRIIPELKKAEMVTVSYNAETKEAQVESIQEFDNAKEAIIKFKIEAANLKFV